MFKKLMHFFGIDSFFQGAYSIWDFFMSSTAALLGTSPDKYAPDAYKYVTKDIYPYLLGAGIALTNMFLLIGFIRQTSNFKETMTLEAVVSLLVRFSVSNGLLYVGIPIMNNIISAGQEMSTYFLNKEDLPNVVTKEMDLGSFLLNALLFGIIFEIVALCCGCTILLTVFQRYLSLYLLMGMYPVAVSTLAGGERISDTFYGWLKTFIGEVFKIVVIALVLQLAGKMVENLNFIDNGGLDDIFDGAIAGIVSMVQMIAVTGAVKGADSLMRKMFAL